jgi:hypothetical protein
VDVAAGQRGRGAPALVLGVVLGDGADWIWRSAWQCLGRRGGAVVERVDVLHAWGHRWTVATAGCGAGPSRAAAWVEPRQGRRLDAGPAPILAALAALTLPPPGAEADPDAAEAVRTALGSCTDPAARRDDPRFVARHRPSGSGAIERTGTTLIQAREQPAGRRWSHPGAQVVASLRALHRSGRWHRLWRTHPQRRRPPIAPAQPSSPSATPPNRLAA